MNTLTEETHTHFENILSQVVEGRPKGFSGLLVVCRNLGTSIIQILHSFNSTYLYKFCVLFDVLSKTCKHPYCTRTKCSPSTFMFSDRAPDLDSIPRPTTTKYPSP